MAHLSHVHSGLIASPAHTLVFAVAGTQAAAQWLGHVAPALSLAEFCETHLHQLLTYVEPNNVAAAMAVFRQAYARRIAEFIAGGKRHG
ncbi:hypothetical protein [Achromobacter xylosoxidans]|uniref:hypothetical protein n=1 Tax=Alcaligenes xylosoxydans xylosoxydans TaxID=85698 RepID=UPI0029301304|nr:hypothetical protein [Achromobacter xylosoxidans]WOB74095.1 hypothetical protein PZA07_01040 [Achromobacter xylosoxidans]